MTKHKQRHLIKWEVEWWEEVNDQATDFYEEMLADNEQECIDQIKEFRPNARKITVKEWAEI